MKFEKFNRFIPALSRQIKTLDLARPTGMKPHEANVLKKLTQEMSPKQDLAKLSLSQTSPAEKGLLIQQTLGNINATRPYSDSEKVSLAISASHPDIIPIGIESTIKSISRTNRLIVNSRNPFELQKSKTGPLLEQIPYREAFAAAADRRTFSSSSKIEGEINIEGKYPRIESWKNNVMSIDSTISQLTLTIDEVHRSISDLKNYDLEQPKLGISNLEKSIKEITSDAQKLDKKLKEAIGDYPYSVSDWGEPGILGTLKGTSQHHSELLRKETGLLKLEDRLREVNSALIKLDFYTRKKEYYLPLAKKHNMTLEQCYTTLAEKVKKHFEGRKFWRRESLRGLIETLDPDSSSYGETKTLHETGRSTALALPEIRIQTEATLFNKGKPLNPEASPVYGYLSKDEHGRDDHAGIYSSIAVCYDDDILGHTTGSIGDSLIIKGHNDDNIKIKQIPVSFNSPNEDCIPLIPGKDPISESFDTYRTYTEGQFQRKEGGPLFNKYIKKVVFMDPFWAKTDDGRRLIQLLERKNQKIPYTIAPDDTWHIPNEDEW